MKSLKLQFESLLDDEDIFYGTNSDKKFIKNWIKDNYKFSGKLTILDDFIVDCTGFAYVKNKSITSLTNGLFRWGEVGGMFNCSSCKNITTLEGSPKYVGDDFWCSACENLTSLEGAPEKVDGCFDCRHCSNLKTLKCAPKKVEMDFSCINCNNLTSLEGAPEEVRGRFVYSNCPNLKISDSDRRIYEMLDYSIINYIF